MIGELSASFANAGAAGTHVASKNQKTNDVMLSERLDNVSLGGSFASDSCAYKPSTAVRRHKSREEADVKNSLVKVENCFQQW